MTDTYAPAPTPDGRRQLPSRRALWFAFLGAPIVWALNLVVGYSVQATVCNTVGESATVLGLQSGRAIPVLLSIVAAIVAAAGVVTAYRCWRATGTGEENPESTVGPSLGRSWFMGFAGMVSSLIFLLAILLIGISELAVGPCWSF